MGAALCVLPLYPFLLSLVLLWIKWKMSRVCSTWSVVVNCGTLKKRGLDGGRRFREGGLETRGLAWMGHMTLLPDLQAHSKLCGRFLLPRIEPKLPCLPHNQTETKCISLPLSFISWQALYHSKEERN